MAGESFSIRVLIQLCMIKLDWILIRLRTCMLQLKVENQLLYLLQVYALNAVSKYQAFVNHVNDALRREESTNSIIISGDFNAHIETDFETWKSVTGKYGDSALNENGLYLLQLCCSGGLCPTNTFFLHRDVYKYTWYIHSMAQKSLLDFCIVSSDLVLEMLDVRVKRGPNYRTDHRLFVCSPRISKSWPNRKSRRSSVTYRIKWEALADRDVRKQFASSMETKFRQLSEVFKNIEMK